MNDQNLNQRHQNDEEEEIEDKPMLASSQRRGLHFVVQSPQQNLGKNEYENRISVSMTPIAQENAISQYPNANMQSQEFIPNEPTPVFNQMPMAQTQQSSWQSSLIQPDSSAGNETRPSSYYLPSQNLATTQAAGGMPEMKQFSTNANSLNLGRPQHTGVVGNWKPSQLHQTTPHQYVSQTRNFDASTHHQPVQQSNFVGFPQAQHAPLGQVNWNQQLQQPIQYQQPPSGHQAPIAQYQQSFVQYQPDQGHIDQTRQYQQPDQSIDQNQPPQQSLIQKVASGPGSLPPSSPPLHQQLTRKSSNPAGAVKSKADHWVQQNSSSAQIHTKGAPWPVKSGKIKSLAAAREEGQTVNPESMQPIHVITNTPGQSPPITTEPQQAPQNEDIKAVLQAPVYSQQGLLAVAKRSPPGAIAALANGSPKTTFSAPVSPHIQRPDQLQLNASYHQNVQPNFGGQSVQQTPVQQQQNQFQQYQQNQMPVQGPIQQQSTPQQPGQTPTQQQQPHQHSWTLIRAVKPPSPQPIQAMSPNAPWSQRQWKSVPSPKSEHPPSMPAMRVDANQQQVPHASENPADTFSTPPSSPPQLRKQQSAAGPTFKQPSPASAPQQSPSGRPPKNPGPGGPVFQNWVALPKPPTPTSPQQPQFPQDGSNQMQSMMQNMQPVMQQQNMQNQNPHPTQQNVPQNVQPGMQSQNMQYQNQYPTYQQQNPHPTQQQVVPQNVQSGTQSQNMQYQNPHPNYQHHNPHPAQPIPPVESPQKPKAPPPVMPKPKMPLQQPPPDWTQQPEPAMQPTQPDPMSDQGQAKSSQPAWRRGKVESNWPPKSQQTPPPIDFAVNTEPESKIWTLEKPQRQEIKSTLEHVIRAPGSGAGQKFKGHRHDDDEDQYLSVKDQSTRSSSAPPVNEGVSVEGQEHLLKPSAIKASQPKYSPEQLKSMDMTIPKAIKSISTAELMNQFTAAWNDANAVGDAEVIRCGLPEHKRPTEAENDTDVEKCIKRLKDNDPAMNEINLNNMKRTPIPQIQRLLASVKENTNLKKLSLANLGLSDNVMEMLLELIEYNTTLEVLNIETNFLTGNFLVRLFQSALVQQTLREVKAVNQSVTFSNAQEQEMMKAIYKNRALVKVSLNLRLNETRAKVERALIRNGELRRLQRKLEAEGWNFQEYLRTLSQQDDNQEGEPSPQPAQ